MSIFQNILDDDENVDMKKKKSHVYTKHMQHIKSHDQIILCHAYATH